MSDQKKRYTLDSLMRVTTHETIERRGRSIKVFMRTLGVAADDSRRDYAGRSAQRILRALKNKDSQEYKDLLASLEEMSREQKLAAILLLKRSDFIREARAEIQPIDAPGAGDAETLRDVIEVAEKEEEIKRDVEQERREYVTRRLEEYSKTLEDKSDKDLTDELRELRISAQINATFNDAFNTATLYWSCFKDAKFKARMFESEEEVKELDPTVYSKLTDAYYEMDGFIENDEELKN